MERLRTIYIDRSAGEEALRIGFAGQVNGTHSVAIKVVGKYSLARVWLAAKEVFQGRRWAQIHLEAPTNVLDVEGKLVFINIGSATKRLGMEDLSKKNPAELSDALMKKHRDLWKNTTVDLKTLPDYPTPRGPIPTSALEAETLDQYIDSLVIRKYMDGPGLAKAAGSSAASGDVRVSDLMRPSANG